MIKHSVSIYSSGDEKNIDNRQLKLYEQYTRELQAENTAKGNQIEQLTKQLNKALAEIDSLRSISKFNSHQRPIQKCNACEQKDNRVSDNSLLILTLKQKISQCEQIIREKANTILGREKSLKDKESMITRLQQSLKELQKNISQSKIKYDRQLTKISEQQSYSKLLQLQRTKSKAQYDNLKGKYEQILKKQQQYVTLSGGPSEKNEYQKQDTILKNQNTIYKKQNEELLKKIQYLQKRIFIVEDTNQVLREQILKKMNEPKIKVQKPVSMKLKKYTCPVCEQLKNSQVALHSQSVILDKSNEKYQHHMSKEKNKNQAVIAKKAGKYSRPIHNNLHAQYKKCHCVVESNKTKDLISYRSEHLSPLRVLDNSVQSAQHYNNYDKKNLIEEHTQNLHRKINILMGQNYKLRKQTTKSYQF